MSVQNLIEGGIPGESHYKSLNYREGKTTVLFRSTFTWTIILNLLMSYFRLLKLNIFWVSSGFTAAFTATVPYSYMGRKPWIR